MIFPWTKILRLGALSFAVVIGAGCVLLLSAYALLQTDAGRARLVDFLNKKMGTPGGMEIIIHRLDGDLFHHIEIERLTVRDKDGEWLRLSTVAIDWQPSALLDGVFLITNLNLSRFNMTRTPVQEDERIPVKFYWPRLPLRIAIDSFSLEDASLEKPVLGEAVAFRAFGNTTVEVHGIVHTKVDVERTDGVPGHAQLDAKFQPKSNCLGVQFSMNEPVGGTLARALDLAGLPSLSIQASGDGSLDDWHGVLRIRAEDLASLDMQLALDVVNKSTLKVDGHADVSRVFDEPLRSILADKLTLDGSMDFTNKGVALRQVDISNELGTVGVSGELEGRDADLKLTITLTQQGIDCVNAYVTPLSTSGIHLDAKLTGPLQQPNISVDVIADSLVVDTISIGRFEGVFEIDFQRQYHRPDANPFIRANCVLTGKLDGFSLGNADLDRLLGPQVSVGSNLVLGPDDEWTIRDVIIKSKAGTLSGGLSIIPDSHSLDGHYRLKVPRLADFSDTVGLSLSGQLDIKGDIGGTLADPSLSAQISSPALTIDGIYLGTLEACLEAVRLAEKPHGHVSMSLCDGRFRNVRAATNFAFLDTAKLELNKFVVESRGTKVTGGLMVPLKGGPVTGSLAGQLSSLAAWSDWFGREVSGTAALALHLSGKGGSQNAEMTLNANDLAMAVKEDKTVDFATINVSTRVTDLLGIPKGWIKFEAQDVKFLDARFPTLSFYGDLDGLTHVTIRTGITGNLHGPFRLDLTGDYSREGQDIEFILSRLDALVTGQTIELEKPARLTLGPDRMAFTDLTLCVANGQISANGRITGDNIEGTLDVTNFPLAAAKIVAPGADVSGILSGHIQISGSRTSPSGQFNLKVVDMRPTTTIIHDVPSFAGYAKGKWSDGHLQLTGEINCLAETNVSLEANLPLRLKPESLALHLPQDAPIDGKVTWRGELEPIWDLLTTNEDRFAGHGDLVLDLGGTLNAFRVRGHFDLTQGQYQNIITGTTFSNVELRIDGDRDQLMLKKLVASDGSDGRIQGHGAIDLNLAEDFPMDVQLDFNDTLLVARDDLKVRASGNLALKGSLRDILLNGKVVTKEVELSLVNNLRQGFVELDVEEINRPDGQPKKSQSKASGSGPGFVGLDLIISVPGKAFVRGSGLDSECKGELKVTGTMDAPIVKGVFEPVRGHFSLMGKSFELKRGSVRFAGTQDFDPILNLAAEYKATGLTAIIMLTGSVSQPKIELTSLPPMPQSEIGARVLFGKDAKDITPAQSLQLASAIATLSGSGGAGGILDATRRTLGIDVFKFGEADSDSTETTVSVGKYVAEGVYVEVEQGTKGDLGTSATVEVELLPNVKMEGGTNQRGGSKVGVRLRWDY